jgi:DNA end-binding protein Ku
LLCQEYAVAASRPYWKGYLKLSLVSCPIALYTASSSSERVSFRQINKKTGNRLRQQLVDDVTREPVEGEDKGRGYEVAKNTYLMVEDAEIEAITIASTQTIEIDKFVPRAQIDERYFESPYYIVPNDQVGQDAFAVIREAMRGKDMAALGRIVLSKRERVIMLQPWDKGIMGTTLRYPYELRDPKEYFDNIADIKLPAEMLQLAEHILQTKAAEFDPSQFVDRYEEAVVAMLKQKQAGMPTPKERPEAPAAQNVVNLMDALRRSIAAGGRTAAAGGGRDEPAEKPAKKSGKRVAGQREMLLPIAGKKDKDKDEAKKPAVRAGARQKKAG